MPRGTIKKLRTDKGFGFIRDDANEGQVVTFVKADSPKGPRAESVRVVTDTINAG